MVRSWDIYISVFSVVNTMPRVTSSGGSKVYTNLDHSQAH